MLFSSLVLLCLHDATATASLIRPVSGPAPVNSTPSSNRTLSPIPQDPFRLSNLFVQPPVAVDFTGFGDPLSRGTADVCLYQALDYAFSTRHHGSLDPIFASDLDYTVSNVSLNFHPTAAVIWEEWKNALYLILRFVDEFETREFFFTVEIFFGMEWYLVGKGYLIAF